MIILDTNVVSELMRLHPQPSVLTWVDEQVPTTLYLTSLTLGEIRFGIAALPAGRRKAALGVALERETLPLFTGRVLAFDEAASFAHGQLRAAARADGQAIGDVDALIAAIALAGGFAVATRDGAPFATVGVRVIDPSENA